MASNQGGTESTNQTLSNAAMRGTAILITVTMTFIVLTGPSQVAFAITIHIHPLLLPFLYLSVALNHSINGLLYCIVGSKFGRNWLTHFAVTEDQLLWIETVGHQSQLKYPVLIKIYKIHYLKIVWQTYQNCRPSFLTESYDIFTTKMRRQLLELVDKLQKWSGKDVKTVAQVFYKNLTVSVISSQKWEGKIQNWLIN